MTTALWLIIFSLGFIFLAYQKPAEMIAFTLFALPFYLIRFKFSEIPTTLLEIMIWCLFIGWLIKNRSVFYQYYIKKLKFGREIIGLRFLLSLLLIAAVIGVINNPSDPLSAIGIGKAYFLQPIIFFFIFTSEIRTNKHRELIFTALGLSVLFVAIIGFYQKFTGWKMDPAFMVGDQVDRITSVYGYPNAIGLYFSPIIAFYSALLIKSFKQLPRARTWPDYFPFLFQILVIISGTTGIILAKSEGAIISLIAAIGAMSLINHKTRVLTITAGVILTLTIWLIPALHQPIIEKITFHDWSGQVRRWMWQDSYKMLADNWLFGAGLNNYPAKFAPYQSTTGIEIFQYPHNFILNFWSETGLIGLIAIIGLVVWYFINLAKIKTTDKFLFGGLMGAMISILVHGLVDVPYFKNDLAVLWWTWFGILLISMPSSFKIYRHQPLSKLN